MVLLVVVLLVLLSTSGGGGQRGRETHSMPLFPSATHLHFTLLRCVNHACVLTKTGTHRKCLNPNMLN